MGNNNIILRELIKNIIEDVIVGNNNNDDNLFDKNNNAKKLDDIKKDIEDLFVQFKANCNGEDFKKTRNDCDGLIKKLNQFKDKISDILDEEN